MARQHMDMALLTRQTRTHRQELGITRSMRCVTVHTILANRGMIPEKRTPFFGMAGVTGIVNRVTHQHLVRAAAMRIVAGCAADLHVAMLGAEQMGRALKRGFANARMAAKAGFLGRRTGQHFLLRLGMVLAVARQAAHFSVVMFSALPRKRVLILRVALKA